MGRLLTPALLLVLLGGVGFLAYQQRAVLIRLYTGMTQGGGTKGPVTPNPLKRYLATVFESPPFVPWPIDQALVDRRIADAGFEQRVLDAIARGDQAFLPGQLAPDIEAQTLLLWCRDDRVIDPSAATIWAAGLQLSRTVMLDGCNHMPMMEQPEATAASLREFLR